MSERGGFWSQRPRPGQDGAGPLVAERLLDLRQVPDGELVERAARPAQVEEVVLATPDGAMVGDCTMASEGNAARRYGRPSSGS